MNFLFDNKIELLYGLDYCINREKSFMKQFNTKESNSYLEAFYNIYKANVSNEIKNKIMAIGDYHFKAEYVLNNYDMSSFNVPYFKEYFDKNKELQEKIIADIKNDQYLEKIDLKLLKNFYCMNLSDNINIILSMFISGGFGIFNGNSNIILGIKYSTKLKKYKITGNIVSKIYHEFSHPYIHKIIADKKIQIKNKDNNIDDCYTNDSGYLEELLVRVMEIIFSSLIYGDEYIKWALNEEDKMNFRQVRKFVNLYFKNIKNINNINDYINLLLSNNLLTTI